MSAIDLFEPARMSFIIRWVHVLAMAVVVGGSAALCTMFLGSERAEDGAPRGAALRAATQYERIFWAALAILVLTGVGNLGAFAGHLPTRETLWGSRLLIKLLCVLALLIVSLLRTSLIAHLGSIRGDRLDGRDRIMIGGAYAATVFLAVAVLSMALLLAHA